MKPGTLGLKNRETKGKRWINDNFKFQNGADVL